MRYLKTYETIIRDDYDQEKEVGDLVRLSKGYFKRNPYKISQSYDIQSLRNMIFIVVGINRINWRYKVNYLEGGELYGWLDHRDMVKLSDEEREEVLMKLNAKKYNL